MNKLSMPEGLINHPALPLTWRPSERLDAIHNFYMDNAKNGTDVLEYSNELKQRYAITDLGVFAVESAIGYSSIGAGVFYGKERTNRDRYEVQREFELDTLGLAPNTANDGLRFHEHAYGLAGGDYPIEPFADLIGSRPENLQAILQDKNATKFGHILLRFSNYLVPVKIHDRDASVVHADMVTQLSKEGEALVDTALWIADYSSK